MNKFKKVEQSEQKLIDEAQKNLNDSIEKFTKHVNDELDKFNEIKNSDDIPCILKDL